MVLVWNVDGVWTQLAQKDLHSAPLERTDANEGGRPRGASAACFNSTFLTLLLGGGGSTSPSAGGAEGLSPGPAQKHNSCAVVGLGDEYPPHLSFSWEGELGSCSVCVTFFAKSLDCSDVICVRASDKQDGWADLSFTNSNWVKLWIYLWNCEIQTWF